MLLLEALALQGDIAGIEVEIGKADSHVDLPLFFLPYICQIAIENADSPEECFERALNVIDMDFDPLQPAPGVYQLWNRQSCKLAMRHVEQQQSLALRSQAIDQSELLAVTGELAISLDARRVSHALKLDPPLWESVTTAPLEDACAAILIRLMNSGEPGLPEYLQALLIQRRIGDLSAFVRNVVEGLENLRTLKSDQVWDLICSAYQEARVLRLRDEAERLRGALLGSPSIHLRLSKMEAASESDRIERQLSPMGRLALRAANWDLERASETPDSWRDAGMLCLGFFRILELEFNERLVVPMVGSLDLVGFEVRLSVLKAGSSNKREAKVLDFWDRLLGSLRKAHGQKKHLELGAMELLLRKIEQVAGVDSDLKALLRATAVMQLSQSGEEALASGRLAALIAEDKRETFRNPPAHARYVDLATAKDCKRYVEEALAKLLDWTRPRDGGRVVH
jgi:hypothetical protein